MSEGNERNLESVAPEAVNDIQEQSGAVEPAADERQMDDREDAPAERGARTGEKRKKSRARSAVVPLVIVLAVLLIAFGALVGYGLARVRSERNVVESPTATEAPDVFAMEDVGEIPDFDVFTEALTQENQQALDVLSGANGFLDENARALLGEDELFAEGFLEGETASPAVEPVVVAEFSGGMQVMSDEILDAYNEQLTMYILSGYSEAEIAETLLDEVLRSAVSERVLEAHARELGVYELTDEDRAEIEVQAAEMYGSFLNYYRENVVSAEGMSEEEIEGAAEAYLLEFEGVTLDGLRAELEANWWEQKLYAAITADVTIDDAAVQADYDARLEAQKADFEAYSNNYEFSQMSGELIVYNLPGYRAVKMLLLGFDDQTALRVYALAEEMAQLEGDAAASHLQEHQADIEEIYADVEARAQAALEQLRGGADMDELILSMGADDGMRDERRRAQGYYVSANSSQWPEAFVTAAMALENVGDYSEPVRVAGGVCILQYLGEVTEGAVPLEDVRDVLEEETLNLARYSAYAEQLDAWLAEADPTYYPERMQ